MLDGMILLLSFLFLLLAAFIKIKLEVLLAS
jgi:hypothetical protein